VSALDPSPTEGGPILRTGRLVLRTVTRGYAPAIVRYLTENREHLAGSVPGWPPDYLTPEFWEGRAEQNRLELARGEALRLLVLPRDDPARVIGMVTFTAITLGASYSCWLGYGIAASEQGKGLASEAVAAGIGHVFGAMGLHRVSAIYAAHNQRSGALLKRLGFTVEGYARDYLLINGRWEDHVLTSLVNRAWRR